MTGTQLKHTVRSEDGKLQAIGISFSFSSPNGGGNGDLSKNLKALIIRVSLPISFAFTPKELCVQAGNLEAAVRHSRQQSPSLPNIQLCVSSQRWRRLGCPGVGGGKEEGLGRS